MPEDSQPKDVTPQRKREYLRAVLQILSEHPDGIAPRSVLDALRGRLHTSGLEMEPYPTQPGTPRFETITRFVTIRAVKSGWMIKRGGLWLITSEGAAALIKYPTAEALGAAARSGYAAWKKSQPSQTDTNVDDLQSGDVAVTAAPSFVTLEDAKEKAAQTIAAHLSALSPYEFQDMVAALLRAMNYHVASIAAPGKDGGVDIVAYKDPLGVELPRLKVQVKHTNGNIGRPEIQKFFGVLGQDDVGIYVSLGGFSGDAKEAVRSHATAKVTLLDTTELVKLWQKFYDTILESEKHFLRLEPVYFLAADDSP